MFKKIATKMKEFITHEDGSELMQFAIVILIVAGLAVIALGIAGSLENKMTDAADKIASIG